MIAETFLCILVGVVCFIAGRLTATASEDFDDGYNSGWAAAFEILGENRED